MKKLYIFAAVFILFAGHAFCQEESERNYVDEKDMTVTEVEELIQSQAMIHRLDFVFGISPLVSINTHKKNAEGKFISAPSPIVVPLYIGLSVPNYTFFSFQPSLRFFTTYNLVYDNMVLPAEVENRTGQTLSFLLNLPVAFKINFKDRTSWSILAGVATFFRYAMLPANIKESAPGYKGSAGADVSYMNSWYYNNLRFLYLSAGFDWMFYYGKTKYGPEIAVFFPVSVLSDKSIDGLMVCAGIKIEL